MFKVIKSLIAVFGFCIFSASQAQERNLSTSYDYGDVTKDVSDISFYQPPANADTCKLNESWTKKDITARNIIFLIGDGMGIAQVQLASLKAVGAEGKLYMEKLPVTGLMTTHSANSHVTDSAAAGTALACGIKTSNGMVGMDPDKTPYKNILEVAQHEGMRTGLVATSTITHATPASFASHVASRGNQEKIAAQILGHGVNVLFGGGKKYWLPDGRKDSRDLINEARSKGYKIVSNSSDLKDVQETHVLGLFNKGPLTTFSPEPPLPELTRKAIDILDRENQNGTGFFEKLVKKGNALLKREPEKEKGFFLMVEGSQIDWACHANNADNCIKQTLLFDLAVKEAVEFAKQDEETLVVITADHECGGMTVFGGDVKNNKPQPKWSSSGHSAVTVPIYAFGPGARLFSGVMDNTAVSAAIADVMGIKKFPIRSH